LAESCLLCKNQRNSKSSDQPSETRKSQSRGEVEKLAKTLAAFHVRCSMTNSKIWGSAEAISRLVANTLADAESLASDSLMQDRIGLAGRYLRRFMTTHRQLLDNRARNGRVRDGHGDLRCDSVCLAPRALVPIDCVKQGESLRYGDVASELASLVLDFEMAERQDLGCALIKAYVMTSNDAEVAELIPFYKCFRALLRGELETLISFQPQYRLERRMLARNNASLWFVVAANMAPA
jgi:aminoglycoside phosphotransferase family enzyme